MAVEYLTLPVCMLEITADDAAVTGVRRAEACAQAQPNALTRAAA